jgi:predicted DsbA family dithiol-disulfide isomerase
MAGRDFGGHVTKAKQLSLDLPQFTRDLDSHRFREAVESDRREGNRLGVDGTPFFFINGHAISGAIDLPTFKHLIESALKETVGRATSAIAAEPKK